MTDVIAKARATIESRLTELRDETQRLEDALAALDATNLSPGARSSAPRKQRRRSKSPGQRAPRGFRQGQFLENVQTSPGARPSEIAKAMGIRPQQVHALARKLLADGVIAKHEAGYISADANKGAGAPTGAGGDASVASNSSGT